jgi:hypothetical protein
MCIVGRWNCTNIQEVNTSTIVISSFWNTKEEEQGVIHYRCSPIETDRVHRAYLIQTRQSISKQNCVNSEIWHSYRLTILMPLNLHLQTLPSWWTDISYQMCPSKILFIGETIRVAEVVCQRLQTVCWEIILIPQYMVVGRSAGPLLTKPKSQNQDSIS